MTATDDRTADQLNRYLDDLVAPDHEMAHRRHAPFNSDLADVVNRVHSLDDAPGADPAFANQLLGTIIGETTRPSALLRAAPQRKGIAGADPPRSLFAEAVPTRPGHGWEWRRIPLATAALIVLVIAATLYAGSPRRLVRHTVQQFVPVTVEFVWSSTGGDAQPPIGPYAPAIDRQGNIWVDDIHHNQFLLLSPEGEFIETWGGPRPLSLATGRTPTEGYGSFDFEFGKSGWIYGAVAFDGEGNIYVLDAGNFRVQKFDADRSFLLAWGSSGRDQGQFSMPIALAVDVQNHVYVLDKNRHDIQVFDSDGQYLRAFGGFGGGDGQFYFDNGGSVVAAPDGTIWVSDPVQHRVQQLTPDGVFLMSIGEEGFAEGQLRWPGPVAADAVGRVYIPDWTTERIQVFAPDGTFLNAWEPPPGKPLYGPTAIVLDGRGNAYVADDQQRRIVKYRLVE